MRQRKPKIRSLKAKSAMITELVHGSKELNNQITRLMAALTRAKQGNYPLQVHQIAPGTEIMGEGKQIGILQTTPVLTMARLAWVRLPPPMVPLLAVAKVLPPLEPQIERLKVLPEVHWVGRNLVPCNVLDARGGTTWLRSVPPQLNL